ncbi:MAG: corrinoid protein [Candidatus Aminicenantales bacterium]
MLNDIQEALVAGQKNEVEVLVEHALTSGIPARRILDEALIAGMEKIGNLYKNNEIFIPEVLVAARAMNAGLAKLEPYLVKDKVEPRGLVVIGTVKGDLHDIGKNLVAMMLKGAGFKIVDLGADVAVERFVEAARTHKANIVALSSLLTTTMIQMKNVIEVLRKAGLPVPVIVGGAPLTQAYADQIGASGYAPDAASAVDVVIKLVSQ